MKSLYLKLIINSVGLGDLVSTQKHPLMFALLEVFPPLVFRNYMITRITRAANLMELCNQEFSTTRRTTKSDLHTCFYFPRMRGREVPVGFNRAKTASAPRRRPECPQSLKPRCADQLRASPVISRAGIAVDRMLFRGASTPSNNPEFNVSNESS